MIPPSSNNNDGLDVPDFAPVLCTSVIFFPIKFPFNTKETPNVLFVDVVHKTLYHCPKVSPVLIFVLLNSLVLMLATISPLKPPLEGVKISTDVPLLREGKRLGY